MSTDREVLMSWDFLHSKKRPKVCVDNRWQNECQCGATFPTLQEWEDHRIDEGIKMLVDVRERAAQSIEAILTNDAEIAADFKFAAEVVRATREEA